MSRKACACFSAVFLSATGVPCADGCPVGMVRALKNVCIDAYEWPNRPGERPLLAVSGEPEEVGTPFDAEMLCLSVGKRPCTRAEWMSACRGPGDSPYPYGNIYDATACNTGERWKEVNAGKVARRDKRELSKLDQSAPAGSFDRCVSPVGAYDMVGNAEEWVRCNSGEYGWCLAGGFWATKGATCSYAVITHSPKWHYYQSGLRCCKDIDREDVCMLQRFYETEPKKSGRLQGITWARQEWATYQGVSNLGGYDSALLQRESYELLELRWPGY